MNETEYNAVLNQNPSAAAIYKIINQELSLVYHNDGYYKMLGIPRAQRQRFQGKNIIRVCHPDDISIIKNNINHIISGQAIVELSFRIQKAEKEYKWIHLTGKVLERNDTGILVYASFSDIDELERLRDTISQQTDEIHAIISQDDKMVFKYDIASGNSYHYTNIRNDIGSNSIVKDLVKFAINNGWVADESIDDYIEFFEKLRRGQQNVSAHVRMLVPDTGFCWIKQDATLLYKKDGTPDYAIISYCRADDFYEKRRQYERILSEQSLSDNDLLFSYHVNITKNTATDYIASSPESFELGVSPTVDTLLSFMLVRIPYNAERRTFSTTFSRKILEKEFLYGNTTKEIEHSFSSQKRGIVWVKTVVKMVRNPDTGDIEGTVFGLDINEKQRMKMLIDRVVDTSYDYIVIIDKFTAKYTTYVSKSDDYFPFESSGLYTKQLLNSFVKILHPDDRDKVISGTTLEAITGALKENGKLDFNYRVIINGETKIKRLVAVYLNETSQDIVLSRSDITNLIIKEEERREDMANALSIAQKANAAKSDFLSRMSHDIRTPMNAIMGMTELAILDINNKEQVEESFKVIRDSSIHLLNLINDILDMSRIESGKMVLSDDITSQKELYDTAIESFIPMAENKEITFISNFDDIHDKCICDSKRISRIINNLCGNAIKFTKPGGTVTSTYHEIPFAKPGLAMFEYILSDTGIGMDEETLSHIYDPFYRASNVFGENTEGTGLGLPIVKSILDFIGGTIDVESKPYKGTKFTVRFILHIADDDTAITTTETNDNQIEIGSLKGLKILLVEDNKINQKISKSLLEKLGATVATANNGQDGYETFYKAPESTYDVILMDIQMPVMNGYEATEAIRNSSHKEAKTIPVIALSANAFSVDVHKSIDAGMNAHISKPVDLKKLYIALSPFIKQ